MPQYEHDFYFYHVHFHHHHFIVSLHMYANVNVSLDLYIEWMHCVAPIFCNIYILSLDRRISLHHLHSYACMHRPHIVQMFF